MIFYQQFRKNLMNYRNLFYICSQHSPSFNCDGRYLLWSFPNCYFSLDIFAFSIIFEHDKRLFLLGLLDQIKHQMIIVQLRQHCFTKTGQKHIKNRIAVQQVDVKTSNNCIYPNIVIFQMKNLSILVFIIVAAASLDFPEYNQCDSKWGNERIGSSTNTICKAGDIITSIAMAMTGLGKNQNPSTLNSWLKANKGYDKNNNFVWNSIIPFGLTYEGMVPNSLIKLNLDVGYIVVMEVNKGPHYVLATGYSGNTINVNDPLYTTTKTYDISTVVTGKTAVYKIPVTSSPPKPSFIASFLNKFVQKLNANSLQQE